MGGAQTRFAALANHLGDRVRHLVVALDGRLDAREKLDAAVAVSFPAMPQAGGQGGGVRAALSFLRQTPADRLITSNWGAMDWAIANRIARLPHLHTEDGFGPDEQDGQLTRRVWTRRLVLRRSEVMLPSQTLVRLARDIWRLPAARLHYIPNGIDTARFAGAAPVAGGLPASLGDGPVIGTIAALRPEKNLARLLAAFAAVRAAGPARLVIVGDGPSRAGLQAEAARLGIAAHVLFAGHSTEPDRWMASFDMFALSSDTEQMPLSVLEAMAAGLPVVATDVGDVRAMVSAENQPLIVRRDAAAMAAAMRLALASGAGEANRRRARVEYDQAAMFKRYGRLLRLPGFDEAKN